MATEGEVALELGTRGPQDAHALVTRQIGGESEQPRLALARRPLEHDDAPDALAGVAELLLDDLALCLALDEQLNVPVVSTSASFHVSGWVCERAQPSWRSALISYPLLMVLTRPDFSLLGVRRGAAGDQNT